MVWRQLYGADFDNSEMASPAVEPKKGEPSLPNKP